MGVAISYAVGETQLINPGSQALPAEPARRLCLHSRRQSRRGRTAHYLSTTPRVTDTGRQLCGIPPRNTEPIQTAAHSLLRYNHQNLTNNHQDQAVSKSKIETRLRQALLQGGKMEHALYEYELEEHIDYW